MQLTPTTVVLLLILSCLLVSISSTHQQDCLPVSISPTKQISCSDTACVYNINTALTTSYTGDNYCFKLTDDSSMVNITLGDDFSAVLSSSYCYYTDDPLPRYTAFCSSTDVCTPPSFTGNTYPSSFSYKTPTYKQQGYSRACYNVAFEAFRRFKVCKLNKPTYSGSVIATYQELTYTIPIANNVGVVKLGTSGVSVVVNLTSSTLPFSTDFVVVDLTAQTDFYFLPYSMVNSESTNDVSRIGWVKVNNVNNAESMINCQSPRGTCNFNVTLPQTSVLQSLMHFSTDCKNPSTTTLSFDNASITRRILELNSANRASMLTKSSVYSDKNLALSISASKDFISHAIARPEHILGYGYLGVDSNGEPIIIGNDINGIPSVTYSSTETVSDRMTNCGVISGDAKVYHALEKAIPNNPTAVSTYMYSFNSSCTYIQRYDAINRDGPFAWQGLGGYDTPQNTELTAYTWPDNMLKRITFYGNNTERGFIPVTVEPLDTTALATVTISLSSLTSISIQVGGELTIPIPKVRSQVTLMNCSSTTCVISSKDEQGCWFESKPAVFRPTYAPLQVSRKNQLMIYPTKDFTGTIEMIVTCGKYSSSLLMDYNFKLLPNGTVVDIDPPSNSWTTELNYLYAEMKKVFVEFFDSFDYDISSFYGTSGLKRALITIGIFTLLAIFTTIIVTILFCCMNQ
ncbi:hypothetical protein NAEGRDRAFT_81886 [Naegleria gruberi]|uniref:Uncharacterized protein n=1 Tax=Naegleria gruberi TaxID=5762 RepID=D2W008_NAEGR|nr:uncharacterized protein NAEGRDRAFT_81886 [Naegleria gruberi]EFC37664.1 hypothetical protein NAEGRDRAFT_81886 [Naegleria gruberi]|eukprot:XP_002670408.1 hypothetical protein NAEGRDRAFT_81886 [Naegleria gruberi strain NEG-M]